MFDFEIQKDNIAIQISLTEREVRDIILSGQDEHSLSLMKEVCSSSWDVSEKLKKWLNES